MSRMHLGWVSAAWLGLVLGAMGAELKPPKDLAPPVEDGPFLVPAPGDASEPVWGVKDGIAIGLWPTPGPRGLIRIYAPYLGQARHRVINFVAIEPVAKGSRGLSELEPSKLDQVDGKAIWPVASVKETPHPRPPWQTPERGRIETVDTVRTLTVAFACERFQNGAQPIVEASLREDRPHEVTFRVFAAPESGPMVACVLTATMSNYARLRRLWLKDEVVASEKLFDPFHADAYDFAPHRQWGLDAMRVSNGEAIVAATSNEADPASATYAPEVVSGWHYRGRPATQYWKAPASTQLVVRVNGRKTYWASHAPIPGGVAFENFELEAPFVPGQVFRFGAIPEGPDALGFPAAKAGE